MRSRRAKFDPTIRNGIPGWVGRRYGRPSYHTFRTAWLVLASLRREEIFERAAQRMADYNK